MGLLKERMEADLKLRNLRPSTQGVYLRCAEELAKHHMRSPIELSEEEVRGFVLYLQEQRSMKRPAPSFLVLGCGKAPRPVECPSSL
jgi:hypothetical protein